MKEYERIEERLPNNDLNSATARLKQYEGTYIKLGQSGKDSHINLRWYKEWLVVSWLTDGNIAVLQKPTRMGWSMRKNEVDVTVALGHHSVFPASRYTMVVVHKKHFSLWFSRDEKHPTCATACAKGWREISDWNGCHRFIRTVN